MGASLHVPCESDAAAVAVPAAKNARRAHLVRCKEVAEVVLIHGLWEVGDVEVGVLFVGKRLELGVERFLGWSVDVNRRQEEEATHPGEADFVAKIVEATDAVFGILEVVILDKSEADWLAGAV